MTSLKHLTISALTVVCTLITPYPAIASKAAALSGEQNFAFKAQSGSEIAAFKGQFMVPENRSNPKSRLIPIHYVRFPATHEQAGSPIVYLAGGPGGSGIQTAKHRRFSLFMSMREFGDVIALDQRGTGQDNDTPHCQSSLREPLDKALSDSEYEALQREALSECLSFWEESKIDIYGYTTVESVADLEDLRRHLGSEKLSLWGISYGSHLALAALKTMSDRLDKVMLASVEGLSQTLKQPARTDAYFLRLQAAINANEPLKAQFPDLRALIKRVHSQLERSPISLTVPESDASVDILFTRRHMQYLTSGSISDPANALRVLQLYQSLDQGEYEPLRQIVMQYGFMNKPIGFHTMSTAMDIASAQNTDYLAEVKKQAQSALLGEQLNSSIHFAGMLPNLELGDDFRKRPISDVPTLILSGTLDGRTYPESQREATDGLNKRQVITVINAGHNLFMTSPEVGEVMANFMRGNALKHTTITVDLPW